MANNASPSVHTRALLMTRPLQSGRRFVAGLSRDALKDVLVCHAPLLEIVPGHETPDLVGMDGVIFTSAQGAALAPLGGGRRAFCVGDRTAQEAKRRGWSVSMVGRTADDLVMMMSEDLPKGPLVHLAGAHRRGEVAARLSAAGVPTDVITLYDQESRTLNAQAQDLLAGEMPVILPLFSPRTAAQFRSQVDLTHRVHAICISTAVAEAVQGRTFASLHTVAEPTSKEMQQAVEMLLRRDSLA